MNELKAWEFENNKFYTVEIGGEPWFIGNQIAAILGYKYPKDAIRDNVDEDDKQLIEKTLLTNRENHEERNTPLGNYAGSGCNSITLFLLYPPFPLGRLLQNNQIEDYIYKNN